MEIVATFPIQLYISIYITLRFDFSKAYAMFWTDCSSILFEVIDTHSLNSCTVFELMGMSAFLFLFFYFIFSSCGTITNVQLWTSMAYGDCLPLFSNDIWLECTFLPSLRFFFFCQSPKQYIYLFLYNHMTMKIRHM